jgi:hypothetical protein
VHKPLAIAVLLGSSATLAEAQVTPPAPPPAEAASAATARKPLNLKVGDVREYMTTNEFRAAVQAPDLERNTVVVEGRPLPPDQRALREAPLGLGALVWGVVNPLQAWRIFVPTVNAAASRPTVDKVPHRRFGIEQGVAD